jgi:hypothetical protein
VRWLKADLRRPGLQSRTRFVVAALIAVIAVVTVSLWITYSINLNPSR